MTREMVVDGLAVVGALSCLYWGVRALLAFLGWVQSSEIERQAREAAALGARAQAAAPSAAAGTPMRPPSGDDVPADHLAAIAGAVAALGDFHIVLIQEAAGHTWANEGRWLHQTSHRLR